MQDLQELFGIFPKPGKVVWIGIRPGRRAELQALEQVEARKSAGLAGDHYRGGAKGKRQVTLIQDEHLTAVAGLLGVAAIDPGQTRRNIVVRGINLLALHNCRFRIGTALLEGTGYCQPCSRMESNLGPGGYNAMRGHGGITARILEDGIIGLGDTVVFVP
ncbi:MAG: MOSC domain-containing protein [Lewinellaceae bacterium]|nr:MOSC domain-containing protein [Lewinellaceae bacterium]